MKIIKPLNKFNDILMGVEFDSTTYQKFMELHLVV